jgi:DNA-binding HxlR family transcriptional regulator
VARTDFGRMHCSIARSLDVIGDPWTPLVVRDLLLGLGRFDDLVADLGISRNLLARRLDHLVAAGVVVKVPYQEAPVRHDYRLTEAGLDLAPVLMALVAWGDKWVGPDEGPPLRFRHACGEVASPVPTCPACGDPMTVDTVTPLAGPGARVAPGTAVVPTLPAFTPGPAPPSPPSPPSGPGGGG